MRYTIADAMADELRGNPAYGPSGIWAFNAGHLDVQHDAFARWAASRGMTYSRAAKGRHPFDVLHSVRRSCTCTARGRELFEIVGTIDYPGLPLHGCLVIQLRPEFR